MSVGSIIHHCAIHLYTILFVKHDFHPNAIRLRVKILSLIVHMYTIQWNSQRANGRDGKDFRNKSFKAFFD